MNRNELSFLNKVVEADQMDIYESANFQELIQFKWDTFARNAHLLGCFAHFFYVLVTIIYIQQVYILNN